MTHVTWPCVKERQGCIYFCFEKLNSQNSMVAQKASGGINTCFTDMLKLYVLMSFSSSEIQGGNWERFVLTRKE